MKEKLLLVLLTGVFITAFSLPTADFLQEQTIKYTDNPTINEIMLKENAEMIDPETILLPLNEIKHMLYQQGITLNRGVINKVLTTLQCTAPSNLEPNTILTVIDYSLPSNEKRLWVFDLKQKKLLFHTYVAHGIKSGALMTDYFSNKNDSKASSMGVYKTEKAYHGREGLTLRLEGLEKGFNDNAMSRSIVMHGGWYVDENFIKKYGRPGRSWGCPALPLELTEPIIKTIKNHSLLVVYYPSDHWFSSSRFLNCHHLSPGQFLAQRSFDNNLLSKESEREAIIFVDLNGNNQREENEPIIVVAADNYEQLFHTKAPLARMLRRQINHVEYIALSNAEFSQLLARNNKIMNEEKKMNLDSVSLVIPEVTMERGYYITHMKIVSLGKIKQVILNLNSSQKDQTQPHYTVYFESRSAINLRFTNRFIRWLGL